MASPTTTGTPTASTPTSGTTPVAATPDSMPTAAASTAAPPVTSVPVSAPLDDNSPPGARRLLGSLQSDPESAEDAVSEDSEWNDDDAYDSEEEVDGESSVEEVSEAESEDEFEGMDTSIILNDEDLRSKVTSLVQGDSCEDNCLQVKAGDLQNFLCSVSYMLPRETKQSVLTSLAMLMKMDTAVRRRGTGERQQFAYYLPLIGRVCRASWCAVYDVSTATFTRYRRQIQGGSFSVKKHGGHMNLNTAKIDIRWLVNRFRAFAKAVGDVVPVRVRTQTTVDGVAKKQYSHEDYTLLPHTFTWIYSTLC